MGGSAYAICDFMAILFFSARDIQIVDKISSIGFPGASQIAKKSERENAFPGGLHLCHIGDVPRLPLSPKLLCHSQFSVTGDVVMIDAVEKLVYLFRDDDRYAPQRGWNEFGD
jgi:hypothetical protein